MHLYYYSTTSFSWKKQISFFFFLFKERSLQYFCSRYKYNKSDKEGEEGMKMRTKGAKDERCSFRDRFTRSVTRRVSTKQIGTSFRTILKDIWPRNLSQGIYRDVHVTRSTNRLNPRARSGGVATLSRQAHRILKFTRRYTVSPKLLETTNFAYQCAWIHPPPMPADSINDFLPHTDILLPSIHPPHWILDSFSSRPVISLPSCYS